MNSYAKKINENLKIIIPIIFIISTFFVLMTKTAFYDETHAFIISHLKLKEIFLLSRIEGHPILWYLILKPFNSLNLYPYSMYFINWIFSSILIVFFWRYCPINNFIKILITFSYPFLNYLAFVARPYTLGVLVLFLLAYFYKDAFKKPILYTCLIVLSANTTIVSFIASFGFIFSFLYELFSKQIRELDKKTLHIVYSILFIGLLFFIAQFIFLEKPQLPDENSGEIFKYYLERFFINPLMIGFDRNLAQILFNISCMVLIYYIPYFLFKKNKQALIILTLSQFSLLFFFSFIYIGSIWHYFHFLFSLISVLWAFWNDFKKSKFITVILIFLFSLNISCYSFTKDGNMEYKKTIAVKKIVEILKQDEYKNAKLITNDSYSHFSSGALIYLKKEGISVYDALGNEKTSYPSIRNLQKANTVQSFDNFSKILDKTKDNFFITAFEYNFLQESFQINQNNQKIIFKLYKNYKSIPLTIYKIEE